MRFAIFLAFAALIASAPACAQSFAEVTLSSLDRNASGGPLGLRAHYARPLGTALAPAALLLHGCGGLYDRSGQISRIYRAMAKLLDEEGYAALAIDSFSTRELKEICTQPQRERVVDVRQRRLDAYGALAWLAARPGVDPGRIIVIGWSHGGSTTLSTMGYEPPAQAGARFSAAIAFYPGCRGYLLPRPPFQLLAPLVILIGEADDWTPADPCRQLSAAVRGRTPALELHLYPGAHHGFDSDRPLRVRSGIPNSATGSVHVGGQPAAREAAHAVVREKLRGWKN